MQDSVFDLGHLTPDVNQKNHVVFLPFRQENGALPRNLLFTKNQNML